MKGNPVHRGDLRRKGGFFGGWKNKHGVIEDDDFAIYKDDKVSFIVFSFILGLSSDAN